MEIFISLKKSIFSSSKFGQKNENRKFYREFVLESSDCFARGYFSIVPPSIIRSPVLDVLLPKLWPWCLNVVYITRDCSMVCTSFHKVTCV
eukprot:UN20681